MIPMAMLLVRLGVSVLVLLSATQPSFNMLPVIVMLNGEMSPLT